MPIFWRVASTGVYRRRAFTARGITPKIEVTATNEDVVKACVEEGLGVAILASIAFDPSRDTKLEAVEVTLLLDQSITNVIMPPWIPSGIRAA